MKGIKMPKYLTKRDVIRLNNKAIRKDKNRSVKTSFYKRLEEGLKYPISFSFYNDKDVRTQIIYGEDPASNNTGDVFTFWLDMDLRDYNELPTVRLG